jgi:hypothetical protein
MKLQQGMKHRAASAADIDHSIYITLLALISLAVSFETVDVKLVIDSVKAAASAAFVAKYSNRPAPSAGTAWLFGGFDSLSEAPPWQPMPGQRS